jgi:hypothetical protein
LPFSPISIDKSRFLNSAFTCSFSSIIANINELKDWFRPYDDLSTADTINWKFLYFSEAEKCRKHFEDNLFRVKVTMSFEPEGDAVTESERTSLLEYSPEKEFSRERFQNEIKDV